MVENINWHPSPNFSDRRGGALPDLIVLHYTAMETTDAARDRLCDPAAQVSAHYLISETGEICQMVDESARAWHAGVGRWGAVDDVNSRSIGIELANRGDHPFAEPQMAALEWLVPKIMQRWHIPAERIIGHSDMAPLRKSDPGIRFDWRRLARKGLSIWPSIETEGKGKLENHLQQFGYPVEEAGLEACLTAFRLRFRPWACGDADATDLRLAADLASRFPVDDCRVWV